MAGNQKQGSSSGNRRDSQGISNLPVAALHCPADKTTSGRAQGRSSQSNSPDDTEDSVTASQSHAPRQQPAPVRQDLQNRESLAAGVRSVLNNFQDLELQNLLLRRYWEVDERSRPEMTRVVEMTVNLLRVAGPRLTLREAVILLLNAGLNQALAALQYIRHREPRLEREVATVLHPPPPPQGKLTVVRYRVAMCSQNSTIASQVKQTLDNDDELPLPDGVRVIEIDPWETGTKGLNPRNVSPCVITDIVKFGPFITMRYVNILLSEIFGDTANIVSNIPTRPIPTLTFQTTSGTRARSLKIRHLPIPINSTGVSTRENGYLM